MQWRLCFKSSFFFITDYLFNEVKRYEDKSNSNTINENATMCKWLDISNVHAYTQAIQSRNTFDFIRYIKRIQVLFHVHISYIHFFIVISLSKLSLNSIYIFFCLFGVKINVYALDCRENHCQ